MKQKGFTFVGLLIAVLIMGGLMLLFLPRYTHQVQQQHQTHMKVLQDARNLQNQLKAQQERQERELDRLAQPRRAPVRKR